MKILQINAVGQTKSTGRTCREIQAYLNDRTEHECRTVFAQGTKDQFSFQIGNRFEWKIHALLSRITGKQAHFSRIGTSRLLRYMDDYHPDVVILRNLHTNFIHFPKLMKYLAAHDIAVIAVLHDCWFFTGKCSYYTTTGCMRWKTGCHHCPRLKIDNPSWLFDATPSLWKEKKKLFEAIPRLAVVGVSDWVTNEARVSYLSCAKEILRIYNWIDLDVFCPQNDTDGLRKRYNLENKKVVLGVATFWGRIKGLSAQCTLAEKLGKEYTVVLIGKRCGGFKLPENIVSIPPTDSAEKLAKWYSLADVFVTTSLEETFGKVSAEAVSCGTPVVCFDSTANRELVGKGCGKSVKAGDLDEMLDAVIEICQNGKSRYQTACRSFAVKNFSQGDRIKDYIALAERLLAAH